MQNIDEDGRYKQVIDFLEKPKRFKDLKKKFGKAPTLSKYLKYLEGQKRIVNEDGWYILIEHSKPEKIKKAIINLREKICRNPTIEEIAVELGENPEDDYFLKSLYSIAKNAKWKKPEPHELNGLVRVS